MTDWLSSTWEASWRPFQYFNFYRLLLACLILLASLLPDSQVSLFHQTSSAGIYQVVLVYLCVVLAGLMASIHWQRRFNTQLLAQVFADDVFVNFLMYWLGGVSSGMGALLLVSLAAASLVGRGRLVLFYAALATLVTLLTQIYGVLVSSFDAASIVQAGFLSAGFFATAILARLLGQRVMVNEELAVIVSTVSLSSIHPAQVVVAGTALLLLSLGMAYHHTGLGIVAPVLYFVVDNG